jgi:ornithine cyclodeaminase/alanine dehydrogenase-like protein (mu-crystallin family)
VSVRILSAGDLRELLSIEACIDAVERALRLHAEGGALPSGVLGVPSRGGGFHVKAAGLLGERAYFAAKVNGNFAANPGRGLPRIRGLLMLADALDGEPLAVMDSAELTALRTAATTAVAARHLARPGAGVVTLCGCGVQGRAQLEALSRVLRLRRVFALDAEPAAAVSLAAELSPRLGIAIEPSVDLAAAAGRSDLVVTCTPSTRPLLSAGVLRAGTFVAAVGADSAEKQELDPALLAGAALVVDHLEQCATIGELHHALGAGAMQREDVRAELPDVVAGKRPGRLSPEEVVVFDSTGIALADVAAAATAYQAALRAGRGVALALS